MKKLITQYGGLKSEIYILFIGRLVTAMGSFVWLVYPMDRKRFPKLYRV